MSGTDEQSNHSQPIVAALESVIKTRQTVRSSKDKKKRWVTDLAIVNIFELLPNACLKSGI